MILKSQEDYIYVYTYTGEKHIFILPYILKEVFIIVYVVKDRKKKKMITLNKKTS